MNLGAIQIVGVSDFHPWDRFDPDYRTLGYTVTKINKED